jgi:hypothetical protein
MQPETLKGGIEVEDPRVFHFRPLRQQPEEQQQLAGIYSRARHKRGKMGRRRNKQEHNPVRLGSCANGPGTHRRERCRAVTHTHLSKELMLSSLDWICLFAFIYLHPTTYIRICKMGVSFGAGHACLCRRMSSPLRRVKIIQYLGLNTFKQK